VMTPLCVDQAAAAWGRARCPRRSVERGEYVAREVLRRVAGADRVVLDADDAVLAERIHLGPVDVGGDRLVA